MFSLGVGLQIADFKRVLQRPVAFLVGALNQVILLPIVTFVVVLLFGISGEMAVGFMILSACPGGVTSNIISRFAKADIALSVTLTAVISLTSVITVPLILGLSFAYFMDQSADDINITATAITMFALTAVPVALGLALRAWKPVPMERADPILARVAGVLFAVVVVGALAANWQLFVDNLQLLGPALIVLLVVLSSIGFVVPRLLGRTVQEAKTISIETGIQNSTLGITIAALIVGAGGFTAFSLPAAVYGILMYLIIIPVVFWFRRIG